MQYVESSLAHCLNFLFLPVASNDNDDLLAFAFPSFDLSTIRNIKRQMRAANEQTGILLHSRGERKFFQEVLDAERYIVLRYFSMNACERTMRELKRRILDNYLFPKPGRKRRKDSPST